MADTDSDTAPDTAPDITTTNTNIAMVQHGRNGLMLRDARGRLLPGTRPDNVITPDTARVYVQRRYAAAQRAFAAGLVRRVQADRPGDLAAATGGDLADSRRATTGAWSVIGDHVTGVLLASDTPRAMSDLARFVGQAAGMLPLSSDRAAPAPAGGDTITATLSGPADALLAVLDAVRAMRDGT